MSCGSQIILWRHYVILLWYVLGLIRKLNFVLPTRGEYSLTVSETSGFHFIKVVQCQKADGFLSGLIKFHAF